MSIPADHAAPAPPHGLSVGTGSASTSLVLRVARVRPCVMAVAANNEQVFVVQVRCRLEDVPRTRRPGLHPLILLVGNDHDGRASSACHHLDFARYSTFLKLIEARFGLLQFP